MKLFIVEDDTVHCYCADSAEAKELQNEVQSIAGSMLERDGEFLYTVVSDPAEAVSELEDAGYAVEWR